MPYCETCHEAAPFHELTAPLKKTIVVHGQELPSAGRCLRCIARSEAMLAGLMLEIASIDYRGNRHRSHSMAELALAETGWKDKK